MRSFITTIVACLLFASCQKPTQLECPEPPLVPKFVSQTHIKGKYANEYASNYFADLQESIILPAVNKALDGSLQVYSPMNEPWDKEYFSTLSQSDIERQFKAIIDTMYIEDPDPPYDLKMIVNDKGTSELEKIVALRTNESWEVDNSFSIKKEVLAYTLVSENLDPTTGEVRGWEPKFTVPCSFDESTKKKVATVRYSQSIDGLQYEDAWYRFNLEYSVREKLFTDLLNAAIDNSMTFYSQPEENAPLTREELSGQIMLVDTQYIESPAPPYDLQMTIISEEPYWGNISAIEFVQDVYVDENLNLSYDVKWYAPCAKLIDRMTGKELGIETLFWVKCS